MKPKIVVIVGATAVGKTSVSIELAKKFNAEIVSADSVQIYKNLDIGSAKVTKEEMQGVKHHLINIKEPSETFSASEYSSIARECIKDILARGKNVIVVGGTGMYVNALLFDFSVTCGRDENYRKELEEIAKKEGSQKLHQMLEEVDKESAKLIHPNHKVRLIRALEIYHLTGKKKSDFSANLSSPYSYLLLCLTMNREKLYQRINKRVDIMLENGLIDEVKGLLNKGITKENQSMSAIGYKETIDYLNGNLSKEKYVEVLKQNSRNYAKRQETYFKKMPNVKFVDSSNKEEIFKIVGEFYG